MRQVGCAFLPGWVVLDVRQTDEEIAVVAEYLLHPATCPECEAELKHHGSLNRHYVEAPVRGRKVSLAVERRRYRCENGHAPQQPLDDCVDGRQMTVRALRYIEHESVRSSMGSIATRIGVSDKTVRDVCSDYFERISESRVPAVVKRLELVKAALGGIESVFLIDRDRGRFLDLVPLNDWHRSTAALLDAACYPELIESVCGPQDLLQGEHLGSIEQEALPTDPRIVGAIRAVESVSKRIGFTMARARTHLWSDPLLHAHILERGFTVRCESCLASCLESEVELTRMKTAQGGKGKWQSMLLCSACRGLRTPMWFNHTHDFIEKKGD